MGKKDAGVVKVSDVWQMPGCMCGPKRCSYCGGKVHANSCKADEPPNLVRCPHCGYPTKSRQIGGPS